MNHADLIVARIEQARQERGIELLWAANGLPEYDVALAAFLER